MPLNSEPLQDVHIELNRLRQELAQIKHTGRGADTDLKRVREEITNLQQENEKVRQASEAEIRHLKDENAKLRQELVHLRSQLSLSPQHA